MSECGSDREDLAHSVAAGGGASGGSYELCRSQDHGYSDICGCDEGPGAKVSIAQRKMGEGTAYSALLNLPAWIRRG